MESLTERDGEGWDYPLLSRAIEKVLAEQEILVRLQNLEENMFSLDQLPTLDISEADIRLPTGEKFDLSEILDIHDRGLSELMALDLAGKDWVNDLIETLGVVTDLNFKDKMLAIMFPVGDQPATTLQDWLTVPPEPEVRLARMVHGFGEAAPLGLVGPGVTGSRPTGQIGLVGPLPGDGIGITPGDGIGITPGDIGMVTPLPDPVPTGRPVRDQVITHVQKFRIVEHRTDTLDQTVTGHGARLNAVEADIVGITAGMPVVDVPTANEILLSILPLDFTRSAGMQGQVTQSLEAWFKSFPTYTEIHDTVITHYMDRIDRARDDIAQNGRDIQHLEDNVFGPMATQLNMASFFATNFFRFIHNDFTVYPDSRNPWRTIPWYLSTEWIHPISGQLNWNTVRDQTGENAVDLRMLEANTDTRLLSLETDVRDIIGDRAVLGAEDYNLIIDHLRAKEWPIGDETRIFQGWMEDFNSRTIGQGQLLANLGDNVGALQNGMGLYDNGFQGDSVLRDFMQTVMNEMAGMKGAFATVSEDVKNFRPEYKKIIDEMNEGFVFPMSVDTFAEILGMAFDRLMNGGIMDYEKGGVEASGTYEFTGLKNAFGESDSEGLRGSSDAMSGSASGFGEYGERDLGWSPPT